MYILGRTHDALVFALTAAMRLRWSPHQGKGDTAQRRVPASISPAGTLLSMEQVVTADKPADSLAFHY